MSHDHHHHESEAHDHHHHDHHHDHHHAGHGHHHHDTGMATLIRIGLVGLVVALCGFGVGIKLTPISGLDLLALIATVVGGWPIFHEAIEAIQGRRMTMELSMTLALIAALAINETFTALLIVFFVLIAEALEGLTMERGRRAVDHLLHELPDHVNVLRDGAEQRISTSEIAPGEVVLVRPGERIPVDGVVCGGHSFAEEAAITGEPVPSEKSKGSRVFAGSINQTGALEVTMENQGAQTAFGRILEAVEKAQATQPPVQRMADKLAGYLVYFALACALVTFVLTQDIRSTISVILVAGACGVAAGTPLALVGALGRATRNGVIIKDGKYLEQLGLVDTLVLDKTGTLTTAQARISRIRPVEGVSESEVLAAAATAESRSEHPLARAVLKKATELELTWAPPDKFGYTPGLGLTCLVGEETLLVGSRKLLEQQGVPTGLLPPPDAAITEIAVSLGGRVLGLVEVEDPLREEARSALAQLRALGLKTLLLTGDAQPVAEAVGAQLQVDESQGGLLPEAKHARVEGLVSSGKIVAMVGDGINDAPALAAAQVGVAMGSGTDVARESADVVLLGNDLEKLVESVRLARRCRSIIYFNFVGTILVDLIGIGLAAFGYLTPILAVLIHVFSELAFILNSARLLPGAAKSL